MNDINNDHVICPNCAHQFRAVPVNVQEELAALRETAGKALELLRELGEERACDHGQLDAALDALRAHLAKRKSK